MGRPSLPSSLNATRIVVPGAPVAVGQVLVPKEASHHARVARVREGDRIEVLDLEGTVGLGRLVSWTGDGCLVEVESVQLDRGEPPEPLVLALGLLHTAAFDWAVEKATELGATAIVPVRCARVQGRIATPRPGRWSRVAAAAVAQCGRSRIPIVHEVVSLEFVLAEASGARLLAHAGSAMPAAPLETGGAGITVLVGPEGGLTEREVAEALDAGFVPVPLGPRALRAETASVASLTIAQQLAGWLH